jgi:hypothetical protein
MAFWPSAAKELVEAAVQHGLFVHGHSDTQEFRDEIRESIKEGHPPS